MRSDGRIIVTQDGGPVILRALMRRMTSRREIDPGSDHCLIGDRLVGTSDF